jgi:processive 1,2-diacylglycerol beta-glucosyltransferase
MGAGHDGAARELCRRLEARGLETRTVDFLDASPRLGRAMKAVYELWLRSAPWAYEATYRMWFVGPILCAPIGAALTLVFGRRIRRWAGDLQANAVVSTYPLASVVLGRLRRRRWQRLRVPAVTFLTDFSVHPLSVHPGVDLNLCLHPSSAAHAQRATGRPSRAPGPLVAEAFRTALPDRATARAELGISPDAQVALVVAGSWGVGEVEQTFDALVATGRYLPLVVCGHNERLRRKLAAEEVGVVLGWTDAMPSLMAASDVLVQNAGGLTCMEAFAAGLPVISVRPIPGHGRHNALDMDRAGVAPLASDPAQLAEALDLALAERSNLAGRGRALFAGDAADDVWSLARASRPLPLPSHRPVGVRLAGASLAAVTMYAGLNVGAEAATALGADAARPLPSQARGVFVGVRLGPASLADPDLAPVLARDHVAAVVEGILARSDPAGVRRLAAYGVPIANGGWGPEEDLHLFMPRNNVTSASRAIAADTGRPCTLYVPGPTPNLSDLAFASAQHEGIVMGTQIPVVLSRPLRPVLGAVYVLDAERATSGQVEAGVARLHRSLARRGIRIAPWSGLKR